MDVSLLTSCSHCTVDPFSSDLNKLYLLCTVAELLRYLCCPSNYVSLLHSIVVTLYSIFSFHCKFVHFFFFATDYWREPVMIRVCFLSSDMQDVWYNMLLNHKSQTWEFVLNFFKSLNHTNENQFVRTLNCVVLWSFHLLNKDSIQKGLRRFAAFTHKLKIHSFD